MTIRNYTFFSPNGTEFPVSANADAKLYLMLSNRDYSQVIVKHWENPTDTSLNRIYNNTSVLLGGRYFELSDEPVQLASNSINFIHANVDPSNLNTPVTITVETANNSNSNDINIGNGVIKHVIDIVTTDATKVTKSETPIQEQGQITTNSRILFPGDTTTNVTPTMSSTWTWNGGYYRVFAGILYLHIEGARPKASLSSPTYPIVGSIPQNIANRMLGNANFRWSNYSGGGTTYGGRLEQATGNIVFYLLPAGTIATNHRFSVDLAIPLKDV